MARLKLRCIMGYPGLKSSYREKGLFQPDDMNQEFRMNILKIIYAL